METKLVRDENIKLNKFILFSIMLFLAVNFVLAEPAFSVKKNTFYNVSITCKLEGYACPATAICNFTSIDQDSNKIIDFAPMVNDGNGKVIYTLAPEQNEKVGVYQASVFCRTDIRNDTSDFNYVVNMTGTTPSITQGIIYCVILAISILLFILSLYGAIAIPAANRLNMDGFLDINYGKYAKFILGYFCYILLLWISWLSYNVSLAFLYVDLGTGLFYFFFMGLMSLLIPSFCFMFAFIILVIWNDFKTFKLSERRLNPR